MDSDERIKYCLAMAIHELNLAMIRKLEKERDERMKNAKPSVEFRLCPEM